MTPDQMRKDAVELWDFCDDEPTAVRLVAYVETLADLLAEVEATAKMDRIVYAAEDLVSQIERYFARHMDPKP